MRSDGERGVRALVPIRSRTFVCEFEGNLLSKAQCEEAEREYERGGKAVYILQVPNHKIPIYLKGFSKET